MSIAETDVDEGMNQRWDGDVSYRSLGIGGPVTSVSILFSGRSRREANHFLNEYLYIND